MKSILMVVALRRSVPLTKPVGTSIVRSRAVATTSSVNASNLWNNATASFAAQKKPQQQLVVPSAISWRHHRQFSTDVIKCYSGSNDDVTRTANEQLILDVLRAKFPDAEHLDVKEGGQSCGEVFEVFVSTKEFKGLNKVKQHQMVIQHIRSIVKDAHVIRVSSQVPTEDHS